MVSQMNVGKINKKTIYQNNLYGYLCGRKKNVSESSFLGK